MHEIHLHDINDHHVTRCIHDHAHGKSSAGSMGMPFEVPQSVSRELPLEQRLDLLLADLKDRAIGKSMRGFGTGGCTTSEANAGGTGNDILHMPLYASSVEQDKTHGQETHHIPSSVLPAWNNERDLTFRRPGGSPEQKETSAQMETTLSRNKDDENRKQTYSASAKTHKKRISGWISTGASGIMEEGISTLQDLSVMASPEVLFTGNYNAQGNFISHGFTGSGMAMDQSR